MICPDWLLSLILLLFCGLSVGARTKRGKFGGFIWHIWCWINQRPPTIGFPLLSYEQWAMSNKQMHPFITDRHKVRICGAQAHTNPIQSIKSIFSHLWRRYLLLLLLLFLMIKRTTNLSNTYISIIAKTCKTNHIWRAKTSTKFYHSNA